MSGDSLTWNDIANLYDKHRGGRAARTLPMNYVAKSLVRDGVLMITKDGEYAIRRRQEEEDKP